MIANAVLGATVVMMALLFFMLDQTKFLIPYKPLLAHQYAKYIWCYAGILFLNLVQVMYLFARKVWVTQLLRQTDAKVFKKYSQMKLQMKREALAKINRHASELGAVGAAGFDTAARV